MSFKITHDLLQSIADRCLFSIPSNEMVFFGIRGCLPVDPEFHDFAKSHELKTATVTNSQPRCTIGQWIPSIKKLAVYPGSTCPNLGGIKEAASEGGDGTNQLLTGYYRYAKGKHLQGKPARGHRAFVQNEDRVVLRNSDDLDFDFEDRVWRGNPGDNLHAGWCPSLDGYYSSLGCQVVVGYPTTLDGSSSESGPWKEFRRAAYELDQANFRYLLINGWEIEGMAANPKVERPALVRFGSTGPLVGRIQNALLGLGLIQFSPDNECGPGTTDAIIRFQKSKFGATNTDGIVGPQTAAALGITDWPVISASSAAIKPSALAALADSAPEKAVPLPGFALDELGHAAGIPWADAVLVREMNSYQGLVRDSVHVFRGTHGPRAVCYQAKFAIDGDGAGGNHEGDPAFQAHTSLRDSMGKHLNSREVDFIVLPLPPKDGSPSLQDLNVGLGDVGVIIYKNGDLIPVIYGDHGPRGKIGEGSMSAAKKLGINPDPNIGGIDAGEIPPGIVHLVFPGSAELSDVENFTGTSIAAIARTRLDARAVKEKALALLAALRAEA